MNEIKQKLRKELKKLQELVELLGGNTSQPGPEGSLIISAERGKTRYYNCVTMPDGTKKRVYLKKEQEELARELAQKEFEEQVVKAGKEQIKVIDDFLKKYDAEAVTGIYPALPNARQALVDPGKLDNIEYAREWQEKKYSPGKFSDDAAEYYTMKSERVRSKSEKIIADRLHTWGIPYRYEYPVKLMDGRTVRPDFTLLNVNTRQEYILEHFGMMNTPEYVNNNFLPKIRSYIKNGYYPGEHLLFTAESPECPLSTKDLDVLLEHSFGPMEYCIRTAHLLS